MKKSSLKRTGFKHKHTDSKRQEDLLDALWRTIIYLRDKGLCQYSLLNDKRTVAGHDAHHIFSRKIKKNGMRWNTTNGILLRAMHNMSDAHVQPEVFREFLIMKWFKSQDVYTRLYVQSQMITSKVDRGLIEYGLLKELYSYAGNLPEDYREMSHTVKLNYLKSLKYRGV